MHDISYSMEKEIFVTRFGSRTVFLANCRAQGTGKLFLMKLVNWWEVMETYDESYMSDTVLATSGVHDRTLICCVWCFTWSPFHVLVEALVQSHRFLRALKCLTSLLDSGK